MEQGNPYLRAALLEVVDNQLRSSDPPETKQAYDRLVSSGTSSKEAKRLIASALLTEMADMMRKHRPHDPARYAKALADLPNLAEFEP